MYIVACFCNVSKRSYTVCSMQPIASVIVFLVLLVQMLQGSAGGCGWHLRNRRNKSKKSAALSQLEVKEPQAGDEMWWEPDELIFGFPQHFSTSQTFCRKMEVKFWSTVIDPELLCGVFRRWLCSTGVQVPVPRFQCWFLSSLCPMCGSSKIVLEATMYHYVPLHCIFQGWWRVLKEPGRNAIMDLELKEDRTRKIDKHPQKTLGSDAVTASCHSNVKLSKLRYLQTPISTLRYIYMYNIYMYNIYI
jgi:hypothetical protein